MRRCLLHYLQASGSDKAEMFSDCFRCARLLQKTSSIFEHYIPLLQLQCVSSSPQLRHYAAPSRGRAVSYYEILETTPKASQKQIKAAYYRLSMKHHPDVSTAPDAKERFSLLAEAYEVLGSRRTRALYDSGSLSPSDLGRRPDAPGGPDDEYGAFFRNKTAFRNRAGPPPSGKTNIFDFDEFNRQHYGEALRRGVEEKKERERFNEEINREILRQRRLVWSYAAMAVFSAVAAFFVTRRK